MATATDFPQGNYEFEASPDLEVVLRVIKGDHVEELDASINISRTTLELKQSLTRHLNIAVAAMEIYKKEDNIQLENDAVLMTYDISADDVLLVVDSSLR